MSMFRFYCVMALLPIFIVTYGHQASAASRSEVASALEASCAVDQASCLKKLNDEIATMACAVGSDGSALQNCSCSAEAIGVASGLADATSAISKINGALSITMAQTVAKNAVPCAQVAFGAVLDGIGTAAVAAPPVASVPASAG